MGFIGLHTANELAGLGQEVILTYHQTYRKPSFLENELEKHIYVEQLDATNPYEMLSLSHKYELSRIIHLVVPPLNASKGSEQYRVNTVSLNNVLEAARACGVERLTIASSMAVYTGVASGPFREDEPLRIESDNTTEAYKKAEEAMALFYGRDQGIDVVSARIAGIYGPLYNKSSRLPNFPMTFIMQACRSAANGLPMEERFVPTGPTLVEADLMYVKDTALALAMLQTSESLPHRIYNVGVGAPTTLGDVISAIKRRVPTMEAPPLPESRVQSRANAYMDTTRIHSDLGFSPRFSLDDAIADYISWLAENPE